MFLSQQTCRRSDVTGRSTKNQGAEEALVEAIQKLNAKGVSAFVTVALQCDGDVAVYSSEHIQQWTDRILPANTSELLRQAHSVASSCPESVKDIDLVFPTQFQANHRSIKRTKNHSSKSPESSKGLPSNDCRIRKDSRRKRPQPQEGFEAPTLTVPRPDSVIDKSESDDEDASEPLPITVPTQSGESLAIGDSPRVEAFLRSRLKNMQQLAVKRIAKAWIKGICPKKQARFPYHNKRREQNGGEIEEAIPKWWPGLSACRFIEPDHIRRSERLELCIHLLRLCPSPEELKRWNKNAVEPHRTHRERGWVEFLEELAPSSLLCDMRDTEDKTSKRRAMVNDMYRCAKMEEQYKDGAIDDNEIFEWIQDEGKPLVVRKLRDCDVSDSDSDLDSAAEHKPRSKKRKTAPSTSGTSPEPTPNVCQNNPIKAKYSKTGIATVSGLQSITSRNMYESFGSNFDDQQSDQTYQAFGAAQRPMATVPFNAQAANKFQAAGNHHQQHCNWDTNELIDPVWLQHVSPATSYVASSSSGSSTCTASSFASHPSPNVYALQQGHPDSKPSHAIDRAHYMHMAGMAQGDTVPNTPQVPSTQVMPLAQQTEKAAPQQQVFRPNAFEHHGLPVQMHPQALMLPTNGSSDFDLAHLDSKQPLGFEQNPLYGRNFDGQYLNPPFGQQPTAFHQNGAAQTDLGYYNQSSDAAFQAPMRMGRRFTTYG